MQVLTEFGDVYRPEKFLYETVRRQRKIFLIGSLSTMKQNLAECDCNRQGEFLKNQEKY